MVPITKNKIKWQHIKSIGFLFFKDGLCSLSFWGIVQFGRKSNGVWTFAMVFICLCLCLLVVVSYMTRLKKEWKWKDVAVDKLKRLGIPYVFFITFAFALKLVLASRVKHAVDTSLGGFLEGFIYPMNSGMKEMWFVAALLLIMFAFPLYKRSLNSKFFLASLFIVALAMPFVFTSYVGGGIFNWQGALRYFIFFYAGILFFKYDVVNRLKMSYGGGQYLLLSI